jgi:hypothetical protein
MTPMLFQPRVRTHFVTAPDLPVNYLLNAKGGCTTVMEHLWRELDRLRGQKTFKGDPHASGPWTRIADLAVEDVDAIVARPTFTMVRNPFARALSGYLSKVGERKEDVFVWGLFRHRFGLDEDAVPTFDEYLEMIEGEPPEMMDRHWSPQYRNLLQPTARIDRVFYLEDFIYAQAFMRSYFPEPMKRSARGFRDARARLESLYTPSAIDRVRRIYAIDFETFGYSTDMSEHRPRAPIDRLRGLPEGLAPFLKFMAASDWKDKLIHLDRFEALHGVDTGSRMARFATGGLNAARAAAAGAILETCGSNWMILREIATIYGRRNMPDEQARFETAADRVHRTILDRPIA